MNTNVLRLGTRRSPMAMAQSAAVARLITERTGRPVELAGMTSFGDTTAAHLDQIGGQGVFVSALRAALAGGEVDLAVHSLKDLPTAAVPGITLAAVPVREDPRDALVGRGGAKLADLPAGARIGTGSPRRAAAIRLMRPDLCPVPIRGNAGTRLAKVTSGDLDAVVLAYAGLARLGQLERVSHVNAPAQVALHECDGARMVFGRLAVELHGYALGPTHVNAEDKKRTLDLIGAHGRCAGQHQQADQQAGHRADHSSLLYSGSGSGKRAGG